MGFGWEVLASGGYERVMCGWALEVSGPLPREDRR